MRAGASWGEAGEARLSLKYNICCKRRVLHTEGVHACGERVCKEQVCKEQVFRVQVCNSKRARSKGASVQGAKVQAASVQRSKCARSASRQRPSAVPEGAVALPAGDNTHPQALGFTYKERHGGRGCVATRCGRQPGGRERLSPGPGPSAPPSPRSPQPRPRPGLTSAPRPPRTGRRRRVWRQHGAARDVSAPLPPRLMAAGGPAHLRGREAGAMLAPVRVPQNSPPLGTASASLTKNTLLYPK